MNTFINQFKCLPNLHFYAYFRIQLLENWESLYMSVIKNNIENLYHGGGVHLKGNIKLQSGDADRIASVVRERGSVALFLAAFLGLQRMVNMLLSVGKCIQAAGRVCFIYIVYLGFMQSDI